MDRIVLLCATRRGYLFLKKLIEIFPDSEKYVFSFREEPGEPLFFDDVRKLIAANGGQFFEAKQLDSDKMVSFWEHTPIDLMLVVSWRYMIPATIYSKPLLGTYVFHDSLLPKYRGFSPTVWAVINGEEQTGVTLFEIAEEVDAGDIIDQESVPLQLDDTISNIIERVTMSYLHILEKNFRGLIDGTAKKYPQDHSQATFTCKRLIDDNKINWTWPSDRIYNFIRALTVPYAGAYSYLNGKKITIWAAKRLPDFRSYAGSIPGRIVQVIPHTGSIVLTGNGALLLTEVQVDGGDIVCGSDVLNSLKHTLKE
jgi:methionyl-tRNA formyltransferase